MKKSVLISSIALVVAISLGLVGSAFAQTPNPNTPINPNNPGMMGRGGMMGRNGTFGPMHDYLVSAMAEAMSVDKAELEAALANGQTMWQFAQAKGYTLEQVQQLMQTARTNAIAKMVEAGVITKEQGDWMLSRMQGMWGQGQRGGINGCPGMGAGRRGNPSSSGFSGRRF